MEKLRKLICSIIGHNGILLSRLDNYSNHSQFGHWKCTRCDYEENYQYDA